MVAISHSGIELGYRDEPFRDPERDGQSEWAERGIVHMPSCVWSTVEILPRFGMHSPDPRGVRVPKS